MQNITIFQIMRRSKINVKVSKDYPQQTLSCLKL